MRSRLIELLFFIYRGFFSPAIHLLAGTGFGCRFQPCCSEYAREALHEHGWLRGLILSARRFSRCHPLSIAGDDPVPRVIGAASVSRCKKGIRHGS